ncbi:MAG: glutamine amidotransferase [Oleiphilaceae bacterium]|nr:glutamine amidotransferase [Oleiphilaceae bacterium]
MATLLIIKTGQTHESIRQHLGDFHDWFASGLARPGLTVLVCDVAAGESLPARSSVDGALVTGSPAMVTDKAPWSETTAGWLARAATEGMPLLGVCYGHHLLARALGGEVGFHPGGREIGTRTVRRLSAADGDPLFGDLPLRFSANLSHKQSVLSLPPGAVLLASGDFEPLQGFRWGEACWGCQFHPEFDRTIMEAYLHSQSEAMAREGLDVPEHFRTLGETPEAAAVLGRFARLVQER